MGNYSLKVTYEDLLSVVKSFSDNDRIRLAKELEALMPKRFQILTKEKITNIMRAVKPYFKHELGKNTHKKTSEDWAFYGLAFTRDDMVYVFGINLGFFKKNEDDFYNHVGMNVLVRTNGEKPEIRKKYVQFFRENLKDWVNQDEGSYTSDRGGAGIELARYKTINEFDSSEEIVKYLKECIDGIHAIYPKILENPDGIFDTVVRAAPQWNEKIIDMCKAHLEEY